MARNDSNFLPWEEDPRNPNAPRPNTGKGTRFSPTAGALIPGGYVPEGGWSLRGPQLDEDGNRMYDTQGNPLTRFWVNPATNEEFTYEDLVAVGVLPANLTYGSTGEAAAIHQKMAQRAFERNFDKIAGIGEYAERARGSGRGGGAAAPVYVKPDERLVKESVKAMLSSLVGTVDAGRVDELTNLFMSEDKRAFAEREVAEVDPLASVQAKIREGADYKSIHKLRPESMDEYEWVSSRQGALQRAGVTPATAERLGVVGAQVGASLQDVTQAGSVAAFTGSGKELDELKGRMSSAMSGVLGLI